MKKKIILFGATGNVGSYVLKYAMEYFNTEEYEIIASGRRETDFFNSWGISYYSVDLTNVQDLDKLPAENVYAVILLSAQIPSYMEVYEPEKYITSIINGGFNVLEWCRKTHVDRILFSTTVFDLAEYPHEHILLADDRPNFNYKGDHAVYVIAKNTMLELLEHYHQEYGLKTFVFRFPTIYCYSPYPYYFPNGVKTKRPLYQMIEKAMKGEPITIYGDGTYAKDMVYVYDCAQMICSAVKVGREKGVYNVGTGQPVTIEEQIRTIVEVFSPKENPSPVVYAPDKICAGGFLMDISNAVIDLQYAPQYDCRKLLEDIKREMEIQRFRELRLRNDETMNTTERKENNCGAQCITKTLQSATNTPFGGGNNYLFVSSKERRTA